MIVGDMNFDDGDEEELLLHSFQDLGLTKKQPTYDVELNTLAQETKLFFEKSKRLDRIFLKCDNCDVKQYDVKKLQLSDHWPISAIIKVK